MAGGSHFRYAPAPERDTGYGEPGRSIAVARPQLVSLDLVSAPECVAGLAHLIKCGIPAARTNLVITACDESKSELQT